LPNVTTKRTRALRSLLFGFVGASVIWVAFLLIDDLDWLPGGDRILVGYHDGDLALVDPTGAARPTVLDPHFSQASSVELSPDGRWILYVAYGGSYAVTAEALDGSSAPTFYSPWTFGLYTNLGELSWQPIDS
jgi:hypothetical protein